MPEPEWIVCDTEAQVFRCERCKWRTAFSVPETAERLRDAWGAFVQAHARCQAPESTTTQGELL